jgi:hypothetical protein
VPVKTEAQLDLQTIHRIRQRLVGRSRRTWPKITPPYWPELPPPLTIVEGDVTGDGNANFQIALLTPWIWCCQLAISC